MNHSQWKSIKRQKTQSNGTKNNAEKNWNTSRLFLHIFSQKNRPAISLEFRKKVDLVGQAPDKKSIDRRTFCPNKKGKGQRQSYTDMYV